MFYEATEAGKVLALKKVGESVWGRLGSKLFVELQGLLISRLGNDFIVYHLNGFFRQVLQRSVNRRLANTETLVHVGRKCALERRCTFK